MRIPFHSWMGGSWTYNKNPNNNTPCRVHDRHTLWLKSSLACAVRAITSSRVDPSKGRCPRTLQANKPHIHTCTHAQTAHTHTQQTAKRYSLIAGSPKDGGVALAGPSRASRNQQRITPTRTHAHTQLPTILHYACTPTVHAHRPSRRQGIVRVGSVHKVKNDAHAPQVGLHAVTSHRQHLGGCTQSHTHKQTNKQTNKQTKRSIISKTQCPQRL
jgi:hypothetical protein